MDEKEAKAPKKEDSQDYPNSETYHEINDSSTLMLSVLEHLELFLGHQIPGEK